MRGFLVVLIFVALLAAAPFVAYQVWGIDVRVWAQQFLDQDNTEQQVETPVEEVVAEPVGPLDWMQDNPDMLALYTADTITPQRYIEVEQLIEPEELLNPGETLPEADLVEIYAAARAPARMIGYCNEVLDTIGNACDVIRTEVRDNRDGRLKLLGRLGYATPIPPGEPAPLETGVFLTAQVALPYAGDLRPENAATTRISYVQQAQDACDALQSRFGNCALARIDFNIYELWLTDLEILPEGTEPQRLEATARFTVYADRTEWNDENFEALVTDIVN